MKRYHSLTLCLIFFSCIISAQIDSTKTHFQNNFWKKGIIPTSLIVSGAMLSGRGFEKGLQDDIRSMVGERYSTEVDDYTRYAPIAQLYIADIAGIEAKNHWFDQTKNLAISLLSTDLLTKGLKKITEKERPDDSALTSWPSGHTSLAFASATVLYEEFKEESLLLAYSGYAFAATTGFLRMANNRHWFSDVLAGAGLGILVTKIVYRIDHLFQWNPFKKDKNMVLVPTLSGNGLVVQFSMQF